MRSFIMKKPIYGLLIAVGMWLLAQVLDSSFSDDLVIGGVTALLNILSLIIFVASIYWVVKKRRSK